MLKHATASALIFLASMASADPQPAPGTDAFCDGFERQVEGVWLDASRAEVLLFRAAVNPDGTSCYAWLNSVAQWSIGNPGVVISEGSLDGATMIVGANRGRAEIDLASGEARFVSGSRVTKGRVLAPR